MHDPGVDETPSPGRAACPTTHPKPLRPAATSVRRKARRKLKALSRIAPEHRHTCPRYVTDVSGNARHPSAQSEQRVDGGVGSGIGN
jgi:hypothetical protein